MASSTQSSSEEQFLCSICLEVFSEPVSTPCGHNFCKRCISQTWDSKVICKCPLCNKIFSIRPELCVNTLLSEMVSQLKLEKTSRSMDHMPLFSEVQCDVCSEPKLKAVKSCLVCLSSFCESHLQPHLTMSGLKRHQLMEPVDDLEDRMCPTHQRPLALFSRIIQKAKTMSNTIQIIILICVACYVLEALSELKSLSLKFNTVIRQAASESAKKELRRVQQFAVDVTLDPDTVNPYLVLSEDLKQVYDKNVWKQLPVSPQRFTYYTIVLGKQSFSSGRFYFEVQVKGKTEWDLGVAKESVNRKGDVDPSPKNGFWIIMLINRDQYSAGSFTLSPQRPPQKVGVFVDYGAGLVSFYDVDSADLLYSFTNCCFREKLFPYFSPEQNKGGTNSAPLIISAVETK